MPENGARCAEVTWRAMDRTPVPESYHRARTYSGGRAPRKLQVPSRLPPGGAWEWDAGKVRDLMEGVLCIILGGGGVDSKCLCDVGCGVFTLH